jgi:DNA processing protein
LGEVLALGDHGLIDAMGGKGRDGLRARYRGCNHDLLLCEAGNASICHHQSGYPRLLTHPDGPRMLHVGGSVARLMELTGGPVVAIVGATRASDYGFEMAKSMARGLSASGVTVTSLLTDGIAIGAQMGALEGTRGSIAVLGGGLKAGCAARRRGLYARVLTHGCAVAELPCHAGGRRWGTIAAGRTVAGLADVVVVVESDAEPSVMPEVLAAQAAGRVVAAVPGRVTSPLSTGTHALLRGGAPLVRGAEDALELLGFPGTGGVGQGDGAGQGKVGAELPARLRRVLDAVGAGSDTPDRLGVSDEEPGEVLLALTELELMGLLVRGSGGRYVPRETARMQ